MKAKWKKMAALLLALSLIASLAGCGGSAAQEPSANAATVTPAEPQEAEAEEKTEPAVISEPVTIQFMHQTTEEARQAIIAEVIEQFETEYPNITVEPIVVREDDYVTKIAAYGGGGEVPAVINVMLSQAQLNAVNAFTDFDAVKEAIERIGGEEKFRPSALESFRSEDGNDYLAVPISAYVQGIWVNTSLLAEKGMDVPHTWDEILAVAKAFSDPANKQYGIAMPTENANFSEQSFSQFALSNGANIFDAEGNVIMDCPEMLEALEFYKELAQYTMPGSNGTTEVKDAFMGGNAVMAIYSTALLNSLIGSDMIDNIAFVLPEKTSAAAFSVGRGMAISSGLSDAEREAAITFVSFLYRDDVYVKWLSQNAGGFLPILDGVFESDTYTSQEKVQKFSHLLGDIGEAFNNMQIFGMVDGKNFNSMGNISGARVISKMINNVVVQGADPASELTAAQEEAENIAKQ